MDDSISRAEAVKKAKECFDMGDCYCDKPAIIGMLNSLAPAHPEGFTKKSNFKPGDKFILEIGERQLDEFEIAGTDYYIRISLLENLRNTN